MVLFDFKKSKSIMCWNLECDRNSDVVVSFLWGEGKFQTATTFCISDLACSSWFEDYMDAEV